MYVDDLNIRSIAIRSSFSHHAKHAGYKQILNYTKPLAVFGIDENKNTPPPLLYKKYQWLYEFSALKYSRKNSIDVLHIMYGEDYYRFASKLFSNTPVVVTFHQPPGLLEQEVKYGNVRGKVGAITHFFSKNRFEKMAAAIVMTNEQKIILSQVMNPDKVFVIPMGTDIKTLFDKSKTIVADTNKNQKNIVTVGNWLRDWEFYFKVVKHCAENKKDWVFYLVNKKGIPEEFMKMIPHLPNLHYENNISDDRLLQLYMEAKCFFLPLTSSAGNNAVMESLTLGCPVIMTNLFDEDTYFIKGPFLKFYRKNDLPHLMLNMEVFMETNQNDKELLADQAKQFVLQFDWKAIGEKTLEVYKHVINNRN